MLQVLLDEIKEFKEAVEKKDKPLIEEEIGDILFTVANLCRKKDINPEIALNKSSDKFLKRATLFIDLRKKFIDLSDEEIEEIKKVWISLDAPVHNYSNDQIRQMMEERRENFKNNAPTSAAQAAEIILNGVKEKRWRILVGEDAKNLDKKVRENPEKAYDTDFVSPFTTE